MIGIGGIGDKDNDSALMKLILSEKISSVNFSVKSFKDLFQAEKNMRNKFEYTTLMVLCKFCPTMLNCDWALELVLEQNG